MPAEYHSDMSRDTVSLTYQELANRLGIDVQSARRRALRSRWAKVPGNDGRARVLVPVIVLPAAGATHATPPPALLPAVAAAEAPLTDAVTVTLEALSHLLSQVAEVGELRERLGRLEAEAEALRQEATAERARAEHAETEAEAQRSRADLATGEVDGMRLGLEHMQDVLAQARREAAETGAKAEQAARAAKDANERLARLHSRGVWARLRNRP